MDLIVTKQLESLNVLERLSYQYSLEGVNIITFSQCLSVTSSHNYIFVLRFVVWWLLQLFVFFLQCFCLWSSWVCLWVRCFSVNRREKKRRGANGILWFRLDIMISYKRLLISRIRKQSQDKFTFLVNQNKSYCLSCMYLRFKLMD